MPKRRQKEVERMDRRSASFRTEQARLVYRVLTTLVEAAKGSDTEVKAIALTLVETVYVCE